jgi:2-aminoadipate transaminase
MIDRRFASRSRPVAAGGKKLPEGTIDLSGGFAYPELLPDISLEAQIAARDFRLETMQYSGTMGLDDLRDEVVKYVSRDGVACERDNVLIVNGAKHALDLACRVFLDPGDSVIVTRPAYITALSILRTFQVTWLTVSQDEEGLDTAELESALKARREAGLPLPKLLFDVPDFHNPTGITTSAKRRRELVALAADYGFVIIEDDPYRKIRFEGSPVAPVKSHDADGVVIAVGTVSKILAPGLRIGWAIADRDIVSRMAAQKSDGGSSAYLQRICVELMRNGQVEHHIQSITETLKRHRDAMVAAFATHLPEVKINTPEGGYYLWAELPAGMDSDMLAGVALEHKVALYSGTLCYAEQPESRFLRLCYSYVAPGEIEEGVRRLAAAFYKIRSGLTAQEACDLKAKAKTMTTY